MLSLVESAWTEGASAASLGESEAEAAALRDFSGPRLAEERLAPATLERLNKIQEIVQEHFVYAAGEVSLQDAALVHWAAALVLRRAARLGACAAATAAI